MKKHETVSTIMAEVRANGSIRTNKPSTITMEIGHRLANDAYGLFLDEKEDKKPEIGLIGFKLVAIYEDGEPEPEPVEIEIEGFDVNIEEEPDPENNDDIDKTEQDDIDEENVNANKKS